MLWSPLLACMCFVFSYCLYCERLWAVAVFGYLTVCLFDAGPCRGKLHIHFGIFPNLQSVLRGNWTNKETFLQLSPGESGGWKTHHFPSAVNEGWDYTENRHFYMLWVSVVVFLFFFFFSMWKLVMMRGKKYPIYKRIFLNTQHVNIVQYVCAMCQTAKAPLLPGFLWLCMGRTLCPAGSRPEEISPSPSSSANRKPFPRVMPVAF